MDALKEFEIPIRGLDTGMHQFVFDLQPDFFNQFPDAPIQQAQMQAKVFADKRDNMITWIIEIQGTLDTACDRCLEHIKLPIQATHDLILKYENDNTSTEPDVVFVDREEPYFQLAPYLYEFACLSVPIVKVYDCENDENAPCNEEVLDYLDQSDEQIVKGETTLGDQLKKLNLNIKKE